MSSPAASEDPSPPKKRTAFSELMSPKPKQPKTPTNQPTILTKTSPTANSRRTNDRRDSLLAYIQNPTSFPPSRVIRHSGSFVTIHDLYPKASVHLLLLPRDPSKYLLHPFDAFSDPTFLASVRAEATELKLLAANELRRQFGHCSLSDQPYLSATRDASPDHDPPANTPSSPRPDRPRTPTGRDWSASILVGIHAHPSMTHLHVHIVSEDRHSPTLRYRKHYNSFSTPFFVPLADFPLASDDVRRHPGREGYLKRDFVCWRCGREFGNRFARLKEHLEVEFEAWKRE